jgi:hypothetical protein
MESACAPMAAPGVGQDAARDADQPPQLGTARDVALAAPGDRVRLGDRIVGVLARRHGPGVGEHAGVGRAIELLEVHVG